jgi:hypothetical protein
MDFMPPRRRVPIPEGRQALGVWRTDPVAAPIAVIATAVRFSLEELSARVPGRTMEVRVPPYGAVQCLPGPTHTRGTPPNVIEMDARTWLDLVTGRTNWNDALAGGTVHASGKRASLAGMVPLFAD